MQKRIIYIFAAGLFLAFAGSCGRGARTAGGGWDTGSETLDSLLNYHDTVTSLDIAGMERLAVYIAEKGNALSTPRGNSAAHFVAANTSLLTGEVSRGRREAREALAALGDEDAPYMRHRILLENARHDTLQSRRSKDLLRLLEYFHNVPDSLAMTDVLGQLSHVYADAGDDRAVAECCDEIVRLAPSFLPQVREIARFNLLLVKRREIESDPQVKKKYVAGLHELESKPEVFRIAPQLGVLVFSDLYGLERRKEYLDSADRYAAAMPFLHGVLKVYASRKLSYYISPLNPDSAARYADMLRDLSARPDGWSLEGLPELMEYYGLAEDTRRLDSVRKEYDARLAADRALHKRDGVAIHSSAQSVREILLEKNADAKPGVWVWIGMAVASILAVTLLSLLRKRRNRAETAEIKAELERTRRKLTVAELKKIDGTDGARSGGDGQWESFEALFTEMHPDFASRLRGRYPALTQNDLRLCAMLSMEMDTKHIARLLNIKPESVKKHKQRLRGKLGMSPDTDWSAFFAQLK